MFGQFFVNYLAADESQLCDLSGVNNIKLFYFVTDEEVE
jgi:hypothetical protein